MVSIPNTITPQPQIHQSDSSFQLALASSTHSTNNNFAAIRDNVKATIAKPTIQQQQLQQSLNKMQGIVFANSIQLQQAQQQAKLQRQSPQQNTSNTHPLATRTIQRAHKIQLTQAPPPPIIQQGEKLSDGSVLFIFLHAATFFSTLLHSSNVYGS